MGRPGGGGGGGHSHGGGGHSSRSGGGHSFGGRPTGNSGRPVRSSSPSYHSTHNSYHSHRHTSHGGRTTVYVNNGPGYYEREVVYTSNISAPVAALIWIVIAAIILSIVVSTFSGGVSSDRAREKVTANTFFNQDCVVDEVGWIENTSKVKMTLQNVFDQTGIQCYIVLKDYMADCTTPAEREEYAHEYYDRHIGDEGTFLYMYFAEADSENDLGYNYYVAGRQIGDFMDANAVEIFWGYLDKYWFGDYTMTEVLQYTYSNWADRCMHKSFNPIIIIVIAALVLVIVLVILVIVDKTIKRKREAAAETERILNTPIEHLSNSKAEDVANKY